MKGSWTKIIFFSILFVFEAPIWAAIDPSSLHQSTSIACKDLKKSFLRVSVHGSNLRHFRVTQMPSGGPYRPLSIRCHRGGCRITRERKFVNRYLPEHPHANRKGFVRYPAINPKRERVALKAAVLELSALARRKTCGSSLHQTEDGVLIKYRLSRNVESDVFNFNSDRRIVSWVRNFRSGKSVILQFDETLSL